MERRSWQKRSRRLKNKFSLDPLAFRGSTLIQMMKKSLGEEMWREKGKLALAWLEETLPTLPMPLTSDAWLGVGVKR